MRRMFFAAFFFSVMTLMVKVAGERLPASEIVFVRSLMALVLSFAMVRMAGLAGFGNRKGLLLLRGLFGFGGLICYFHATVALPLADVTVLHFTNPVFTAILGTVVLGEKMRGREILGTLMSLAGVVLVAQPSALFGAHGAALAPWAVGVALLGAVSSACAYVSVRKLGQTDPPLMVVMYFPLVATPASLPLMWGEALWPTPREWLLLLGIAVTTQLGQVLLTQGLHQERAGRALAMGYVQIVFAVLWGALVFHDLPNALAVLGAALVVGGALVL